MRVRFALVGAVLLLVGVAVGVAATTLSDDSPPAQVAATTPAPSPSVSSACAGISDLGDDPSRNLLAGDLAADHPDPAVAAAGEQLMEAAQQAIDATAEENDPAGARADAQLALDRAQVALAEACADVDE